jgi:hypothetical protein
MKPLFPDRGAELALALSLAEYPDAARVRTRPDTWAAAETYLHAHQYLVEAEKWETTALYDLVTILDPEDDL